jgi:hypothetical protein
LEHVQALVVLQRSGVVEQSLTGPTYLVPFTSFCKGCGERLQCDGHEHYILGYDMAGVSNYVVMRSTCEKCGIRYGYDSFTKEDKVFRLSAPREYVVVSNHFLMSRPLLNQVKVGEGFFFMG